MLSHFEVAMAAENQYEPKIRYNRLRLFLVILMSVISVVPLLILAFTNYTQYEQAFSNEMSHQVTRRISTIKQSLEMFIDERKAAINFLINDKSFEDLSNEKELQKLLTRLKKSFDGFVDLGLIDSEGNHRSYAGPYNLFGKNYKGQSWFQEVVLDQIYVSDVFMGFRQFPHFVIAVKHEKEDGSFYILRATLNTDMFKKKIYSLEFRPQSDACLINRNGVLQTPSRIYGNVLDDSRITIPSYSRNAVVQQKKDSTGSPYIFGYAFIQDSPFILIVNKSSDDFLAGLIGIRRNLLILLTISIILILAVIFRSTTYLVRRIEKSDLKQAKLLHSAQYTNKMASIGRLATGVAHEINNPLAIINEKAGLLKDLATFNDDFKYKDKTFDIVNSILNSVERCSTITHRLLGFAKRMDINAELIDIELLLNEVTGFLSSEAAYKNIDISFHFEENLPSITSDRGQLQQVFLNIITNAFYAVKEEKGSIKISAERGRNRMINVIVEDNGVGISKEHLDHIFEPFFTTKGKYGTGLGLSITYGIVHKLGGDIKVKSELGAGTTFTIILPIESQNV